MGAGGAAFLTASTLTAALLLRNGFPLGGAPATLLLTLFVFVGTRECLEAAVAATVVLVVDDDNKANHSMAPHEIQRTNFMFDSCLFRSSLFLIQKTSRWGTQKAMPMMMASLSLLLCGDEKRDGSTPIHKS